MPHADIECGTCPLCAAEDFAPFRFGLLRCGGCGLVVDSAIFRPGAAETLNEDAFGEAYDTRRSFWVRAFETVKNRRYLANLRRAKVTDGKLLEVGVGRGSFLVAARKAGFEVEGCDLSPTLCQRVQLATGIAVHNLPLEHLPQGAYDVVAMHHVLEHVADPVGFLRAASERLKPGGVVHVAVPNVACWEARLRGWNSYEPYHVLYFEPRTLVEAMKRRAIGSCACARSKRFRPGFSRLFAPYVLLARFLQRQRGALRRRQLWNTPIALRWSSRACSPGRCAAFRVGSARETN